MVTNKPDTLQKWRFDCALKQCEGNSRKFEQRVCLLLGCPEQNTTCDLNCSILKATISQQFFPHQSQFHPSQRPAPVSENQV